MERRDPQEAPETGQGASVAGTGTGRLSVAGVCVQRGYCNGGGGWEPVHGKSHTGGRLAAILDASTTKGRTAGLSRGEGKGSRGVVTLPVLRGQVLIPLI